MKLSTAQRRLFWLLLASAIGAFFLLTPSWIIHYPMNYYDCKKMEHDPAKCARHPERYTDVVDYNGTIGMY